MIRPEALVLRTSARRPFAGVVAALIAFAVLGVAATDARAGTVQSAEFDYFHQQWGQKFDTVGKFDLKFSAGDALCSGVIIGDRYVLTAGHCVYSDGDTVRNMVFNINGERIRAQSWAMHPAWDGSNDALIQGRDIAIVKLRRPITKGKVAYYARSGDHNDQIVTMAGFGATGTGSTGEVLPAGTKRAGENRADVSGPGEYNLSQAGFDVDFNRLYIIDFDAEGQFIDNPEEDVPLPLEYMIARGDSGGGLFSGGTVIGITSFGAGNSAFGSSGGFTRVASHTRWIKRTLRQLRRNANRANFGRPGNPIDIDQFAPEGETNPTLSVTTEHGQAEIYPLLQWTTGPQAAQGLAAPGAAVPEPTTAAALAALAAATLLRRRRGD